jgi:hypothetical protein
MWAANLSAARAPKTRDEIEVLLLAELRSHDCEAAIAVWVVADDDPRTGANWTVSFYDAGTADRVSCGLVMDDIVPRFQSFYELVQKH